MTLQRVIVRMLYDSAFAEAVVVDPGKSLEGLGLDSRHIAFLTEPDPRVWRLDPHRRARSLEALLDEYPTTSVAITHATRSISALDAFFSSPCFHRCIQERGRIALAFGDYLGDLAVGLKQDEIHGLARLEWAIAAFRRGEREVRAAPVELQLSPQVSIVRAREGVLEFYVSVRAQLAAAGQSAASAITSQNLDGLPPVTLGDEVTLMLEAQPDESGPSISQLSTELGALLSKVSEGTSLHGFRRVAQQYGANEHEIIEILESLIADGLVSRNVV